MAAQGLFDSFDRPAQHALQWSAVMSAIRAERESPDIPVHTDVNDLFVGILLVQPETSLASVMLEHFDLQAGQLLPPDYPLPSEADIERYIHAIPDDPDVYTNVQIILDGAVDLGQRYSQSPVPLALLFIALFDEHNELSARIAISGTSPKTICYTGSFNVIIRRSPPI